MLPAVGNNNGDLFVIRRRPADYIIAIIQLNKLNKMNKSREIGEFARRQLVRLPSARLMTAGACGSCDGINCVSAEAALPGFAERSIF
ncbi:hypothetical protein SAMN04488557_0716 [Hyphomicrobium facile]|uniref:Uncharacterized protein n=1 Tax=Hyphomicrobium facile TaxID=51670 RepID=A0A1I7MXZ0_9HYPH|nr:hypothetical protein SAMN04488557_0716 [Hyphomicrobium facile]